MVEFSREEGVVFDEGDEFVEELEIYLALVGDLGEDC